MSSRSATGIRSVSYTHLTLPTKIKERWAKVKKIVHDDALNADIDLFLRVLEPVEKMVRLFDGMKGVYIGVAYEALLQYETMLSNPIEGLAEADRVKILEVYKARWKYLHKPIYTAAMMLHQAFCRQHFDKSQRDELEAVFKKLSTPHAEYTPEEVPAASLQKKWTRKKSRLRVGSAHVATRILATTRVPSDSTAPRHRANHRSLRAARAPHQRR